MILLLLSLSLPLHAAERTNALRTHYTAGFESMPAASKKAALIYATAYSKVFSVLGTGGLAKKQILDEAFEKELHPILKPLADGTPVEKQAYECGLKIHEAMHYLGACGRHEREPDDAVLNALLRYPPDAAQTSTARISKGVFELLYDYLQLVDPQVFNTAVQQTNTTPSPLDLSN